MSVRANTDTLKNSFVFRTISKWNTFPVSIIHAGSVNEQPPNCDATACRLSPVSVLVHMNTWELSSRSRSPQGRIQDLKKEGAQGVRGLAPKIFLANFGDFSKYLAQKELGVRPPPPSGSAPAPGQSVRSV